MRAVVYLRVSSDEQAESGAGLLAQLDACRAHAGRAGLEVVGPFADEGIGGARPLDQRPGLLDALAELAAGDVLLVAKRDRLARDPIVAALIEDAAKKSGARVVSAAGEGTDDDSPTNVLMRRIVDAFAEYERLLIKARTRAALAAKRRRGERTGSVPLGHDLADDGKTLVANAAEAAAVALIRTLKAEGRSLRQIAAALDAAGIPTKTGKPSWDHTSVRRILHRET